MPFGFLLPKEASFFDLFDKQADYAVQAAAHFAKMVADYKNITWLPAYSFDCNHCKTGLGTCLNNYSYPKNYFPLFQKYMLKRKKMMFSDELKMTIICPSQWLQNRINDSFLSKFKIKVISNSIDTDIFKPAVNKNDLRKAYREALDKYKEINE